MHERAGYADNIPYNATPEQGGTLAKAPRYEGMTAATTAGQAARTVLGALLEAVLADAPAVLSGEDVRATHDMRVAIRRLRSALATFRRCAPRKSWAELATATKRIGRKLGAVRDADVHLAALRAALAGAAAGEAAGISYAIDALTARRRRDLADFAIELSQFDRRGFARFVDAL
jgi:CHAD domain-containing protein